MMPKKKREIYRIAYYDSDGKRRGKTFTADTLPKAMELAEKWKQDNDIGSVRSITVGEALAGYLSVKRNVLSPSTLRSYSAYIRSHFDTISGIRLSDLKKKDVQAWVSMLSESLSPKSVKNCHALLSSALNMYDETLNFKIQLPQMVPHDPYCPSDEDIKTLINYLKKNHSKTLLIAVYLAAFGPLRAGEICAVESSDVDGNFITVNKSLAYTSDNTWVTKTPKTVSSNRTLEFPSFVIEELAGIEGRLVPITPVALYDRFRRAVKSAGLRPFRFHDLRGYSISIQHAVGVADLYIMKRAGHSTDYTMKKHYRHIIDSETRRQTDLALSHFNQFM